MPRQTQPQARDPWVPIRSTSTGTAPPLPGPRGRYVVYLEPPMIRDTGDGKGRYCHFSWKGESFALRDFITGMERRQSSDLTVEQVWQTARDRIPAKGDLFVPIENGRFWREKLDTLTSVFHATQP
jgi:hypothetical protein